MKFAIATCAVTFATAFPTDTLRAQGTVQSITARRVDVVQLASGYRASKVIGSTVMALPAANRRCLEIVQLAIRRAEAAWNFERLQQVPDEIIDAIAVLSPEPVQRILGRLNRVADAWNVRSG